VGILAFKRKEYLTEAQVIAGSNPVARPTYKPPENKGKSIKSRGKREKKKPSL